MNVSTVYNFLLKNSSIVVTLGLSVGFRINLKPIRMNLLKLSQSESYPLKLFKVS